MRLSLFCLRWCVVGFLIFTVWPVAFRQAHAQEPQQLVLFEHIAVVPFFVGMRHPKMDQDQDQDLVMNCTISEICVSEPSIAPEAGTTLTRLADQQLQRRFPLHVVALDQARAAYAQIALDKEQDTPRTVARKIGESLNADFVLMGTVWRYRERGAIKDLQDSPTAVGFELYLVRAGSGELIWRQKYEESQETVFSNLFKAKERLKMGLTWLSAEQLARLGMDEAFKRFPDRIQPVGISGAAMPAVPEKQAGVP